MIKLRESNASASRPAPDEADLSEPRHEDGRVAAMLRTIGAIAVLVVGAVHLQQYVSGYDGIAIRRRPLCELPGAKRVEAGAEHANEEAPGSAPAGAVAAGSAHSGWFPVQTRRSRGSDERYDLHQLAELVGSGCAPALAVRIL